MIAKVSIGRSFGGTVRYLHEGHKNEQVNKGTQLLDYNGIRPGMNEMIKDFDRHRWLNPDLGNAVGHISLSYHQQDSDRINNAKMIQHAREVMRRLGMNPEETQFVLIRHHDRDHAHCHLVYNRVDYYGKTISDQFSKGRVREAATVIARRDGLTVASETKKDLSSTNKARLPGHDKARYQVYEAIQKALPQATSIEELTQALKTHHIETSIQKGGKGMSFRIGSYTVKASAVDRAYSGEKLQAAVAQNRVAKQPILPPPRPPVKPAEKRFSVGGYSLTSAEKARLVAGETVQSSREDEAHNVFVAELKRVGDKIQVTRLPTPSTPPASQPHSTPPPSEKPLIIKGYPLTSEEKNRLLAGDTLHLRLMGDDHRPFSADVKRAGTAIRIDRVKPGQAPPPPPPQPAPPLEEKPFIIKGYTLTGEEKIRLLQRGDTLRLPLIDDNKNPFLADVKREGGKIRIDPVKPMPVPQPPPAPPVQEKPSIIQGYALTTAEKAQLLGGATLRLRLMGEDGKPFLADVKREGANVHIQRVKSIATLSLIPPSPTPLTPVANSVTEPPAPEASAGKEEELMKPPTPPAWHAKALATYTQLGGRVLALRTNGFSVEFLRTNGKVTDYLLRPHGSPAQIAVKLSELLANHPLDQKLKVNKGPKLG